MNEPIAFSGNPLDRASNFRRDAEWLAKHRDHPDSRYLAFYKLNALSANGELVWLSASEMGVGTYRSLGFKSVATQVNYSLVP